jgi:(p)ppGpp synthase/HD superfamily hydrolase
MKERIGTLDDAFKFMKTKHGIQERKTGGYYFEHPRRVSALVIKFKDSYRIEDLLIAALLHDTLEDTTATYEQIENKFGTMIADIVLELTSDKTLTANAQSKREYLANKMVNMSSYALVIKLCDRLDNISDLDATDAAFRARYVDETIYLMDEIDKKREVITITQHRLIHEIRKELAKYEN